jgi:hypothetical protein
MRNFGSSFMEEAAALLIKAQGELSRIVDTLPDFYPRPVAPAAQSASFSLRSDDSSFSGELHANGVIQLTATHGELTYNATFPTRVKDIADFTATVKLGKGEWHQDLNLNGAQFFDTEGISADFASLHEKVLEAAKRYLPGLRGLTGNLAREAREAAAQAARAATAQGASVEEKAPETGTSEAEAAATELCEVNIRRPGKRDLRFKGEMLAGVRTGVGFGRGWDYRVYRTAGGKIVAVQTGLTSFLGEQDRVSVEVFDKVEDVQQFFGATELAKVLYQRLGLTFEEFLD